MNLAMLVVTHRTRPGTRGWRMKGSRWSGSSPAPKSLPSAITACEKLSVSGCRPESTTGAAGASRAAEVVEGVREMRRMEGGTYAAIEANEANSRHAASPMAPRPTPCPWSAEAPYGRVNKKK